MSHVTQVSNANWKAEVIDCPTPVLVDFWAEWCGPCKMIAPILDELSAEMASQLKFVKVNVDENHEIASQFGIRSIPTILIFKGGQVKGQMVGAMGKAQLKERLGTYL